MKKYTIEDMQRIAEDRGGECRSNNYINYNTDLKWRCQEGHEWIATPHNVIRGTWCPYCAKNVKLSIEEMQNIAKERGGECLSTKYINSNTKLKWECNDGHVWKATPDSIKHGSWCPHCAGSIKLTIEEMQRIATDRGGLCLSIEYINNETKLKWKCGKGHVWETTPSTIINGGHWCPHCAGNVKLSIKEMQELAERKGGMCLSKKYINVDTKLRWRCKEGHEWEATPGSVKYGTWCPHCIGRHKTIKDMQKIAEERGGKCLSKEYINTETKLRWRCKEGHEWEATPAHIKSGEWCPHCAHNVRLTLKEMQEIAKERGGKCLSKKYITSQTKLRWKCKEDHEWENTPSNIKKGQWCPICSSGIHERICRKTFEYIFNSKFPTKKPKWLINLNGIRLELDGYNKKLGLAFEYQGRQHYHFVSHFHKSEEEFIQRQQDDEQKRALCKQNEVVLIEIPYTIEKDKIIKYILKECRKKRIKVPSQSSLETFDYRNFEGVYSPEKLKEMQKLANERGWKCLSTEYLGSNTRLKWRCEKGHKWEATPSSIKSGSGCSHCSHKVKLTIEEMQDIAIERGGKCLSDEYIDAKTKLRWVCKEGHEWEDTPSNIKHLGRWCSTCARNRRRKTKA